MEKKTNDEILKKIEEYESLQNDLEAEERFTSTDIEVMKESNQHIECLKNSKQDCIASIKEQALRSLFVVKNYNNKMYVYNFTIYKLRFINSLGDLEKAIRETSKVKSVKKSNLIDRALSELENTEWKLIKDEYTDSHLIELLNDIYEEQKKDFDFKERLSGFGGKYEEAVNNEMFYRGQNDSNYSLEPSLYRNKGHLKNEHHLYKEIQVWSQKSFEGATGHLELLTMMQHYNLPTRLLDLTTSPLVALFFAVESQEMSKKDGEIVLFRTIDQNVNYFDSDTVTILSAIPTLTYVEKTELLVASLNAVKNYLKEIKPILEMEEKLDKEAGVPDMVVRKEKGNQNREIISEKTKNMIEDYNQKWTVKKLKHEIGKISKVYLDEINPFDLFKILIVQPKQNNERIIRQQGAFIMYGLVSSDTTFQALKKFRVLSDEKMNKEGFSKRIMKFIIPANAKKGLKESLSLLGINETSVYPELVDVADYLKEKYQG